LITSNPMNPASMKINKLSSRSPAITPPTLESFKPLERPGLVPAVFFR
jgi:hypothetical protein